MREHLITLRRTTAYRRVDGFLHSPALPVIMAAVMLTCYYTGQDMVAIWFLAVCALSILFFCRDLTPLFALFLFMNIIISMRNTPSPSGAQSDYYTRPYIYIQIIVAISLSVCGLIARVGINIAKGQFKPAGMFYGVCALAATFLLNGLFSGGYEPLNALFGFFMSAVFVGIYMLVNGNITDENCYRKIAIYFSTFSLVLMTELAVAYLTYEGVYKDGLVDRAVLFFGWGMYNQMGMLLSLCIPAWFYLAIIKRYGGIFTAFGIANIFAVYFTHSRQSMVGGAVIALVCIVWLLVRSKREQRPVHIALVCAGGAVAVLLICLNLNAVGRYLGHLFENIEKGGNRAALWQRALEDFASAPLFGVGFYHLKDLDAGTVGLKIIPLMYHSTPLQMLGACGIVGFAAYAVHRVQTVVCYAKNPTLPRTYLAITMGGLLLISLFDNHMFYIFPTIMYVAMAALLQCGRNRDQNL